MTSAPGSEQPDSSGATGEHVNQTIPGDHSLADRTRDRDDGVTAIEPAQRGEVEARFAPATAEAAAGSLERSSRRSSRSTQERG